MSNLDPLLQMLSTPALDAASLGLVTDGDRLRVFVRCRGQVADLTSVGFTQEFSVGATAVGLVPAANLTQLAEHASVLRVDAATWRTSQLDVSVPETRANLLHSAATPYKGAGVIVGVIDSGVDYTHDCFRKPDGTSRILFLWDRYGSPSGTFTAPTGFTGGVEYTKANLDAALATATPLSTIPHQDHPSPATPTSTASGHGTHVTGIAAGNGRASGGGDAANTFVGMAPEADIIVVSAINPATDLFSDADVLAGIRYIFGKADRLRRPCVINISIGGESGPMDGSTPYERTLDDTLDGAPGRALVISAGNAGSANGHAGGTWVTGTASRLSVQVNGCRNFVVELWYRSRDRMSFRITDPAGNVSGVNPDGANVAATGLGTDSYRGFWTGDSPDNHQNRMAIVVFNPAGGASTVANGTWHFDLTPTAVADGRFHAWTWSRAGASAFTTLTGTPTSLSSPGCAREVITVANYVPANGTLRPSSGRGPTTDGRFKPEIAAPGTNIKSARARGVPGATPYQFMSGTSMAAPHVTGAVALLFQKYPTLVASQVRRGLEATARSDANTGAVPNNDWGYGKLDAKALVDRVYPTPMTRDWVRMQPRMANWPLAAAPPIFDVYAQESGTAVIELAWDPASLLTPSSGHTGADALRYYNTSMNFVKTYTKADGSTGNLNIPAQPITLVANRASWTMPQALWDAYREEAARSMRSPPASTFSCNLYYRVRVSPAGAAEGIVWPADAAIQGNPNAPRMGLIRAASAPAATAIPDAAAVAAMGGIPGHPDTWGRLLTQLWTDLPAADPDRQALARIFAHAVFSGEMTVAQRGRFLTLWLFAGPASRRRLPELLERRAWINRTDTVAIAVQLDRTGARTLTENLLALTQIVPHRDIAGVLTPEQLVDDVLTELLDPNGRVNRGNTYTGTVAAVQAMLIQVNASEYVRLLQGLLSQGGVVNLANGQNVEVPGGVFQIPRYGAAQTDPLYVRTYAELAFQTALLAYGVGPTFPHADPAAAPNSPTGVATVFGATLRTGLTLAQQIRVLNGVFNTTFSGTIEEPSAALRDRFLAALRESRVPIPLILNWPDSTATPTTGLAAVLALRYDTARVFYKNPQYPGSNPPAEAQVGATANRPPRRFEDPPATLESIADSDLTAWIRGFLVPNASLL